MKNIKENKESFFTRNFTKKRIDCPKCHNSIDAYIEKCPFCANERQVDVLPKKYSQMTFLSDYKELCFFFIGTLGLFLIATFINLGITSFPIKQEGLITALVNLISYIIILALFFCVVAHDAPKIGNTFKSQTTKLKTLIFVIAGLAIIIAFSQLYTYILNNNHISIVDTENQKAITTIVKKWPGIAFFFVVLFGPIVEEFTYRVGLFSLLRKRNRYLAYIVTVLLFAFIHFIPSFVADPSQMAKEALSIPVYIVPSLVLAITYEYAGVSASIYTHILNNLISFILILAL